MLFLTNKKDEQTVQSVDYEFVCNDIIIDNIEYAYLFELNISDYKGDVDLTEFIIKLITEVYRKPFWYLYFYTLHVPGELTHYVRFSDCNQNQIFTNISESLLQKAIGLQ
jgi:hypothetical protein